MLKAGGKVSARCAHPLPAQRLLVVPAAGAVVARRKIIGLANAGGDTINSIKQATEFGITKGGQKLAGLLVFITDIHALGLKTAQGLILHRDASTGTATTETRAWSRKRFFAQIKRKYPTMVQAGVYSAVLHYLKAVKAAKTDDGDQGARADEEDADQRPLFGKGTIRADGRMIHRPYLIEVKKPAESKGPWDYYKVVATIPAEQAFRPLNQGECPLVK